MANYSEQELSWMAHVTLENCRAGFADGWMVINETCRRTGLNQRQVVHKLLKLEENVHG